MGKRIYYDDFLRYTKYIPAMQREAYFYFKTTNAEMRVEYFEAPTIEELLKKVKAAGHPVWGKKIEDYNHCPRYRV